MSDKSVIKKIEAIIEACEEAKKNAIDNQKKKEKK